MTFEKELKLIHAAFECTDWDARDDLLNDILGDLVSRERSEVFDLMNEQLKEVKIKIKSSHQFACLESWCKTRNGGDDTYEDYCKNCQELNNLFGGCV